MSSTTSRPSRGTRSKPWIQVASGIPVILVGFLCYGLTNLFDGGFFRGLFQGATIALMVLGAYLVGTGIWTSRRTEEDLRGGASWLPSRDGQGDRPS